MENNNQNACKTGGPGTLHDSFTSSGTGFMFNDEALANCLADLKRQLELRQAMH
ncbi:MAG: hypothetical protein ACM31P_02300 [Actinomycetota bacterium]